MITGRSVFTSGTCSACTNNGNGLASRRPKIFVQIAIGRYAVNSIREKMNDLVDAVHGTKNLNWRASVSD